MNSIASVVSRAIQHSQLAGVFPDLWLKSVVILAVAAAICLGWRRSAASARHLVWFLAVAGLLCLPGLSGLLPAWQRPLWTVGTRPGSNNELTLALGFVPAGGSAATGQRASEPPPVAGVPDASAAHTTQGPVFSAQLPTIWAATGIAAWSAGALLLLLGAAVGRLRLRGVRRAAHSPSDKGWISLLHGLCEEIGVGRRVTLLQSEENVMPVTWGWWRPVILLPAGADAWCADRRRVVVLHELAHVKRWDCLTQMVVRIACAIYWFNPLVWVAARQMCLERERACDDLVLNGGCKPSDYAAHLVEIARTFRRRPGMAAIAMARSSHLGGRVAAIVDASRVRRPPRTWRLALCALAVLGLVAAVAAQRPEAEATSSATRSPRPWFDERLRAFFAAKAAQARHLAAEDPQAVSPQVWPYFSAGTNGDWQTATNLWATMRARAHQYEGVAQADTNLDKVWAPILETELAWEQFANWKEKYVLAYGNDIIKSIPPGSIYFGGTDPGRGVITAMSTSHAEGKPFFTITQNALADGTYLEYLRAMYGPMISIPTGEDSQACFQEYMSDAERRLAEGKLKPGEDVRRKEGRVEVSGQIAVMSINGLLAKTIFDRNTNREFYVEESFPLDWMYPYLSPNGLILKIHRQPLDRLSDDQVRQDHEYWSNYLRPMLGDWLKDSTSAAEVAGFAEKVYLKHDLGGFKGDPQFVEDTWAQKGFSKLRSSIGGVYAWRATNAKTPEEKQRMTQAADFAFRQAYALCPSSPEALFRYVQVLVVSQRIDDACVIAENSLKLNPEDVSVRGLLEQLKKIRADRRGTPSEDSGR